MIYKFVASNLFYMLFCVLPVCYDVHLSHRNKDYLLTYLDGDKVIAISRAAVLRRGR